MYDGRADGAEGKPRWSRPRLVVAAVGAASVLAAVSLLLAGSGDKGRKIVTSDTTGPSTTAPTSLPVTTAVSLVPTTPESVVTTTTSTTTAPAPTTTVAAAATGSSPPISGTVTDSAGHPVAGAYVIGLDSLTVVRTDSAGRWSMPCQITANAMTGNRTEPLVAATWLLPVEPAGGGGYSYGANTTKYDAPPTTPGLGYAFSGGASDAAHAKVITCSGQPVDFVLPLGGGADVQFLDQTGHPATQFAGPPVDNLYLPGLGTHAALETAPLTSDSHQIIQQLGPGMLNLDILYPMSCTETAGPQPGPVSGSYVAISAGRTSDITCRETSSASPTGNAGGAPTSTTGT